MKRLLFNTIRWGVPSAIAFVFLILPDLVKYDMAHPSWIVRIFFVVYLSNSFFGAADVFYNPSAIKSGVDKYRNSDKDTLIFSYLLGHLLYTISTICLFYYGLDSFYPFAGWWKYLSSVIYGTLIITIHYSACKMQTRQIREIQKDEVTKRT
jgi:hypothetical protein